MTKEDLGRRKLGGAYDINLNLSLLVRDLFNMDEKVTDGYDTVWDLV